MNYNEAIRLAIRGKKLLLPNWVGYFYWNWGENDLNFRNEDYKLNSVELKKFNLKDRIDWYYII